MINPQGSRFSSIQQSMDQRRRDFDRIDSQVAQLHSYTGRLLLSGFGVIDVAVDVNFPVSFTRKPTFTYGIELEENWTAAAGTVPTVTALIMKWIRHERLPGIHTYTGATLGAVALGTPGLVWIVYKMEGPAFRNPIRTSGNPEEPI